MNTLTKSKQRKFNRWLLLSIVLLLEFNPLFANTTNASETNPDSIAQHFWDSNDHYLYIASYQQFDYRILIPVTKSYPYIRDQKLKAKAALLIGRLNILAFDSHSSVLFLKKAISECHRNQLWQLETIAYRWLARANRTLRQSERNDSLMLACTAFISEHEIGINILDYLFTMSEHYSLTKQNPEANIRVAHQFIKTIKSFEKTYATDKRLALLQKYELSFIYLELGVNYYKIGDAKNAKNYLLKAEKLLLINQELAYLTRCYQLLMADALKNRDIIASEKYWTLYNEYSTKFHAHIIKNLHNTPEHVREIEQLKEFNRIKELEIGLLKKNAYLFFTLFIAIVAILIIILLLINKRQKEKTDKLKSDFEFSQRINEEKSRHFAVLAHELRTPIYAITGLSSLLHNPINITQKNISGIINSGNHLLNLVNNVLQYNFITEDNKVHLKIESCSLPPLIQRCVHTVSYLASQKGVSIELEQNIDEKFTYKTDHEKLAQIIINLLTNAIRHSFQNGVVSLSVRTQSTDNHQCLIRFTVSNQGASIPKSKIDHIFKYKISDYKPEKKDNKENMEGLGIGLYVVRHYLDAMDSKVFVKSDPISGTQFYFEVLLQKDHKKEVPEVSLEFEADYKILVVDDNKVNLIVSKHTLQLLGIKCITATDSDPIIDIVKKESIDLILMDINMPSISGYDLSLQLRKSGFEKPIILLTALQEESIDHELMEKANIQDAVIKPFEIQDLRNTLKKYLIQKVS